MNISIKLFFVLTNLFIGLIGMLSIYYIFELKETNDKLEAIEHNRYLMISEADALRQSSDDLTRFARTYAITGDKKYKDNYFNILDIRSGAVAKPKNYNGIYWDLQEPLRSQRHPLDKKVSIDENMEKLPYSRFEFAKLKESTMNSDDLIELEVEAFYAMEGIFKDENGEYTIQSDTADQLLAIDILHSKAYHKAKEKIMLPIDEFLVSLDNRTKTSVEKYNKKIKSIFHKIFLFLGIAFISFIFTFFIVVKKVLIPIQKLTKTILAFQKGERNIKEYEVYGDEVGLMTEQFFAMKKKLDDDYSAIEKLSLTDPLTNIGNRRLFFELSEELLKLSKRTKDNISIAVIDIDFFKKINDIYGHIIGDDILKFLVATLKDELRESDVFARYGGEEFVILFPQTDLEGVIVTAERLRERVEKTPYTKGDITINMTISIGVQSFNYNESLIELINRADEGLYQAKENGRNRVEIGEN